MYDPDCYEEQEVPRMFIIELIIDACHYVMGMLHEFCDWIGVCK